MKNRVIMDTSNTFFKYKTYRMEGYKIIYGDNNVPFIVGEGRHINSTNDYITKIKEGSKKDSLAKKILKWQDYIKFGDISKNIIAFKNFLTDMENNYREEKSQLIYNKQKKLSLNNLVEYQAISNVEDSYKYINNFTDNYEKLINSIYETIKEFGMPEDLLEDDENGDYKINIHNVILKTIEVFKFKEDFEDNKIPYEALEISSAHYILKKDENDEPQLVAYFKCPFEYLKFKIILAELTGRNIIKTCEFCGSLFIAERSRRRFCEDYCRISKFRLNKERK